MTPQKKAIEYKKLAIQRIEHLREFLQFTTDSEVLVASMGDKAVKFMDASGYANDLYVGGRTWNDFYVNLCTIEDAIAFTIECGREE